MLLLIESTWNALTGDSAAYMRSVQAAIALADADGRPFPRTVARTLGATGAPYVEGAEFALGIAAQARELGHRFGFQWLALIAESTHAWADACVNGPNQNATDLIEARLSDVVSVGHRGTEAALLIMLADVQALGGRVDLAGASLARARQRPGPYRGLVLDVVDRRVRALACG
jgi:hypothetical protein